MIEYLFNNYFTFYFAAFIAIITLIWNAQERYSLFKISKSNKRQRLFIDIMVCMILAIPTGVIISNWTLINERSSTTEKVSDFAEKIIERIKDTDIDYGKTGYGSSYPRTIPYPMVLNEYDFLFLKKRYSRIAHQICRHFSPGTCRSCNMPFTYLSKPHSSLFDVEVVEGDKAWLKNGIAYTREQVSALNNSLDDCVNSLDREAKLVFLPNE